MCECFPSHSSPLISPFLSFTFTCLLSITSPLLFSIITCTQLPSWAECAAREALPADAPLNGLTRHVNEGFWLGVCLLAQLLLAVCVSVSVRMCLHLLGLLWWRTWWRGECWGWRQGRLEEGGEVQSACKALCFFLLHLDLPGQCSHAPCFPVSQGSHCCGVQ